MTITSTSEIQIYYKQAQRRAAMDHLTSIIILT